MWLINAVLLLLANMFLPANFVLGTHRTGVLMAAVSASLLWTIIVYLVDPLLRKLGVKTGSDMKSVVIYLVANFVAIWITARMAPLTGFGVASFIWVALLAVVGNIVQFINWTVMTKAKLVDSA